MEAKRLSAASVLVVLAVLALPAGAAATTYCVSKPACVSAGGVNEGSDLQAALTAAATNPGPDRVELGPGIFQRVGGFSYAALDPVQIVGNGTQGDWVATASLLQDTTTNPSSEATLSVNSLGPSTVSNLALEIPGGTGSGDTGLALTHATANGVDVRGSSSAATSSTGVQLADATFAGGRVQSLGFFDSGLATVSGRLNRVADATIDGSAYAVQAATGTTLRVERSQLHADAASVEVLPDSTVSLDSTSMGFRNVTSFSPATAIFFVDSSGGDETVDAHNVTLLGNGQVGSSGVLMRNDYSRVDSLNLVDSVISGYPTSISRQTPGVGASDVVTTDHSAYAPVSDTGTVSGSRSEVARLSIADPGFMDPVHGDVHLRPDSPLIDAGGSGPGGGSATDLGGEPRVVDGRGTCAAVRDVGAYEFQPGPRPPHATASAAPASLKTGQAVAFSAAGSCDPDQGALSFGWSFDDGASATGASVKHTFTTGGVHSAVLTVTDAAGRSTTATARVTVLAKRFAGISLTTRRATVRKGKAGVSLSCPLGTNGRCRGTLTLTARTSSRRHAKRVKLGSARVTISVGGHASVTLKLSRAGLALLRHALKVTVTIAGTDGVGATKTTTASLTLTTAARPRRAR